MAAVLGANFYRAATQSFTPDEAYTYNLYVSQPLRQTFTLYDANNHVLYTLLARASAGALGASEFSLRLPSVLGGGLYLGGVFLLCRLALGSGWMFLLAVGALSLNPFLLDYLSVGRGYGLSLGFFVWGFYALARYHGQPHIRYLYGGAAGLALAMAANLTFAFPAAALAGVFTILLLAEKRAEPLLDHFFLPCAAIAFVFLVLPLSHASRESFYVGASSLRGTLDGLVVGGYYSDPRQEGPNDWLQLGLRQFAIRWVPVAVALLPAGLWVAARKKPAGAARSGFLLAGGGILGSLGLSVAAHTLAGVPYPEYRTGIYFIPLFCLACLTFAEWAGRWWVKLPVAAFFLLSAAQFAREWNVSHYQEWHFAARTREVVEKIRERGVPAGRGRARVGASWVLEPGLNFYRQIYRLDWIEPVDRSSPGGGFDYYVLLPPETTLVEKLGLKKLYEDRFSGVVLAVPD